MLLIDGHNLIGSGALADISLEDEDDEIKLVARLRAWRSRYPNKMVVIFDRGWTEGRSRELSGAGVEVRFARNPTDADDLILRRIRQRLPNLIVVTNDARLLQEARLYRIKTWRPFDFVEQMTDDDGPQTEDDARTQIPNPGVQADLQLSPQELSEWEFMFETKEPTKEDTVWQPPIKPKDKPKEQSAAPLRKKKSGKGESDKEAPRKESTSPQTPSTDAKSSASESSDRKAAGKEPKKSSDLAQPQKKQDRELDEWEALFGSVDQQEDDRYWRPPMERGPKRPRAPKKQGTPSTASTGQEKQTPESTEDDGLSEFERLFGQRPQDDDADPFYTPPMAKPDLPIQRRRAEQEKEMDEWERLFGEKSDLDQDKYWQPEDEPFSGKSEPESTGQDKQKNEDKRKKK